MEFKNFEQYERHVDKIISDNLNKMLGEPQITGAIELISKELEIDNNPNFTKQEFEKIALISTAIVKCLSKHIVYATLESLHQINEEA